MLVILFDGTLQEKFPSMPIDFLNLITIGGVFLSAINIFKKGYA